MRARRDFQPSLDLMPMRLAPSGLALVSPFSPVAGGGSSSKVILSPEEPISGTDGGTPSNPTPGPGSYTPPVTTTMPC